MYRLFILISFGIFSLFSINAKVLSINDAIAYANKTSISQFKQSHMMSPMSVNAKKEVTYKLKHTLKTSGRPTVYVVDKSNGGFMLLAANDDVGNGLLGYVDSGNFDPDSIPEGLQYMLEAFDTAVYYADVLEDKQKKEYSHQYKPSIAPLIISKWSYSGLYKQYCPEFNGSTCVPGCVSIAISQILNYHRFPECGKGNISYKASTIGQNIAYDFGENPIDWGNINPNISAPVTDIGWKAVAKLLYMAGVAVKTNYGVSSSSSNLTNAHSALVNTFDYSKQTQKIQRSWYTNEEWEDVVYNELFNGRPVLYSGVSETEGGHAFICDGYNNGYFHINWGWGGYGDGYFLLSALDPKDKSVGFSRNEGILIGIEPKLDNPSYVPTIVMPGDLKFSTTSESKTSGNYILVKCNSGICNQSITRVEGIFGIRMVNTDNGEICYIMSNTSKSINANGAITNYSIKTSDLPEEGTWVTTPSFFQLSDSTWYDIHIPKTKEWAYVTEVKSDSLFFYPQSDAIANDIIDVATIINLTVPPTTNYFSPMDVELSVTNKTMYRTTKIYTPVLLNNDTIVAKGSMQVVDLEPDECENITWKSYWSNEMHSGSYQVALMNSKGKLSNNRVDIQVENIGNMSTAAAKIILSDISSAHYVEVYDAKGIIVAKGENLKRSFKPGLYIIQYTLDNGSKEIKKIFVK